MALGCEIVDFIRLGLLHDADQVRGIGHVAVMQLELLVLDVRVFVDVFDAAGIEARGAPLDSVYDVSLGQEEAGKVGAVLSGDAGDQRGFLLGHAHSVMLPAISAGHLKFRPFQTSGGCCPAASVGYSVQPQQARANSP